MKFMKIGQTGPAAVLTLLLLASVSTVSHAQQTPYVTGSTVTGHVFCADSNAPARFAKVLLKSTKGDHSGEEFLKSMTESMEKIVAAKGETAPAKAPAPPAKPLSADKQQALAASSKGLTQAMDMLNASTVGFNGEFKFAGVTAGTYYVHVLYPGYIDLFDQFSDEDFASADPAVRARIAQIPTVTVTGADSANADLSLERGAAISGRVLFDDGSPAAGWTLSVIKPGTPDNAGEATAVAMNQALAISGAVQIAKSDDLGHFRIVGLAPAEYAVRASMIAPSIGITAKNIGDGGSGIQLVVYSGDTFSRAEAKPITVSAGEEHSGADITVPARSLHNIVGHVFAKFDAHTLNVGMVVLTSKSDPALHITAAIRDDGSFHFEYLPGGVNYTLTVTDAADGRNTPATSPSFMGINLPNTEILHKYGSDSIDVLLGDSDLDSARLTVAQTDWTPPAKKPGAPNVSLGDILSGIMSAASSDKPTN